MKYILIFLLFFSLKSYAQEPVYVEMKSNYKYKGIRMDSLFILPNLDTTNARKVTGAVVRQSNAFYWYNGTAWTQFGAGGGGETDTTSLSNRINDKIDSLRRIGTEVSFKKNGSWYNAYTDSVGGQNGRWGNDTALVIFAKVHNGTGTTLSRGTVVMISGSNGDVASVIKANNKYDSTSARTIGLVKDNISAGDTGWVVTQGQASKLNLGAYSPGDVLYLDSIDGGLTKTKPVAPYHQVFVCIVERANNGNGLAYVKPLNGQELGEIHDVRIQNPLNNQILVYSDTQDIWKNRLLGSLLMASAPLNISKNTNNSYDLSIPVATGTQDGYLDNKDWETFNNKLGASDTAALSTRINAKADTSALNLKLNAADTISLSNRINAKLTASDTTSLSNRINTKLNASDTASLSNRINLKINISDTASMLSAYLRKADTTSLSNRINAKLNISDTSSMLSSYLRKTDTASLSNRINTKLNISDTATMLTPYLRKADTTSLSNRINTKLNISDTSGLQPKSIASYSMLVNNTNAAANMTTTNFRTSSGTYTNTIAWTGTTAPSGATNHSYRWQQIGNMVTLNISLVYGSAGSALTQVIMDLPSDAPTPLTPSGLSGNSSIVYPGSGHMSNALTLSANNQRCALQTNSTNTGYQIINAAASAAYRYVEVTVNYFTQ